MYTISGNEHIHSFWIILLASSSVALRMAVSCLSRSSKSHSLHGSGAAGCAGRERVSCLHVSLSGLVFAASYGQPCLILFQT